jgi:hypothetical protein
MDWIKQNKFLAGFLLIILIVGGGLGFLAFTAKGKYDQAYTDYDEKAKRLTGLYGQQPYPEQENVKKMQDVQKAHQEAIDELHKDLIASQIPLKPLTPTKFQDDLRETVRRVVAKAASRNVAFGDKSDHDKQANFYLGFNNYQGVPPKDEAAAPLGRMLAAMELALDTLIDSGVISLGDIKRETLPEEGGGSGNTPDASSKPQRDRDKDKEKGLAERHWFEIQFVAAEPQFRTFLNELISQKQLFIPSSVIVESTETKGPSKAETATPPPPPPPPPGPGNPPSPGVPPPAPAKQTKIVVGDEKLKVTARIEIVNFAAK